MSYLEHFKFDKPPFGLSPDPDFVYWSKQHSRAKAYMESTIWLSDGFVVITGEIGSGKTTLLQSFLGELGDDVVYAVVSQTQLNATQFLQAILTEFGFKPFDKKKVELLDMINMFLIEQYSAGKKVILIIDEAQNLTPKVLEEVRLLSGIETSKEKVLRIILAGQPELRDTLDTPELKQLVQRVRLRFHLGALDQRDMREYIEHRLKVAGREEGGLFTEEAFPLIYRYSGGVPRLINTICDSALLVAFADEKTVIGPDEIENTAEELGWQEHEDTTGEHEVLPRLVTASPSKNHLTRIELLINGEPAGEFFFEAGRVIIGRAPDSEIHVNSRFVSRHHAQLVSTPEGCFVEDLNSTNGIQLNGNPVQKQLLDDGDVISIDENKFIYHDLREVEDVEEDGKGTRTG
ncbi:MAG: AAA family ATPase [Gammaproteobacteria bacterium]|nr:AAA family ATPase [Gammaproteobacteria bacterium]